MLSSVRRPSRPTPRPRRATRLGAALFAKLLFARLPLAMLLLALGFAPGAGWAQKRGDPPRTRPSVDAGPPPAEILALADADPERQWRALAGLRQDRSAAREALVAALQREEPLPGRWRLMFRMVEFGQPDDLPLLVGLRAQAQNPWERRMAEGAVRALYAPLRPREGLETLVAEFTFIQTRAPVPVDDAERGKWMLTRWSIADYHRGEVPLATIKNVQPLRGKAFDSREQLADALQKRLSAGEWKAQRDRLLASAEAMPARVRLEGLARVTLRNPLDKPLLLQVSLGAWFGRLVDSPGPTWVYLEPKVPQTFDLPVSPQGNLQHPILRLDLRLEEVNGRAIPSFHKLYLPLQP